MTDPTIPNNPTVPHPIPTQQPSSPPTKTHALTAFSITTGYDQIWLDIGGTRLFIYPELAIKLAEALKRHAAILRPQPPDTENT